MTQEYHQVHPQDVQHNWELFAALIHKAMTKSRQEEYTLQGCYERLVYNQWQLFVILKNEELESIVVTSVLPFDLCCYLNVIFVAGVGDKKVDIGYMDKSLKEIAVSFKCDRLIGGGRKGWQKALNKFGWKDLNLVVKEL